jgi:hypothetical protein
MSDTAGKTTKVPWDVDLSSAKVEVPLATMQRLITVEEHDGLLRDAIENITAGSAQKAGTIRAQCRLLVRAGDEGPQV